MRQRVVILNGCLRFRLRVEHRCNRSGHEQHSHPDQARDIGAPSQRHVSQTSVGSRSYNALKLFVTSGWRECLCDVATAMKLFWIRAGRHRARVIIASASLIAGTLAGSVAAAQAPNPSSSQSASALPASPAPTSDTGSSNDTDFLRATKNSDRIAAAFSATDNLAADASTVSTDQLLAVLGTHPEYLPAVKRLVVSSMRQQGEDVSVDTVSSDDLYDALDNDPKLRAAVLHMVGAAQADPGSGIPATAESYSTADPSLIESTVIESELDPSAALSDINLTDRQRTLNSRSSYAARREAALSIRPRTERMPAPAAPPVVHRPSPYSGLQSLRDLYTQFKAQEQPLQRFGLSFFQHNASLVALPVTMPLDVPAGPDYVLGPGDRLTLSLSGAMTQRFPISVDSEGRIPMADAGMLLVSGKTIHQAQSEIERALAPYYNQVRADISLSRVRAIRVYVVGEVNHPGAYDVSSLSTALNALVAAGGPTERGSLRFIKQYRGKQLVAQIDFYDFLLHGVRSDVQRLESGDTILVPPVGPQVAVAGMVKRPAIYEIQNEKDLADVIDLAGGLLVSATLQNVKVERTEAHERHAMLSVNLPDGSSVQDLRKMLGSLGIQDGDRLTISPILPYTAQVVYVQGHVARPGKYAYRSGMDVGQIIRSYNDVLPEPADRAEIIRLEPPDYRPKVIDFNLKEILDGTDPIELKPLDTIRIYGRYEADAPLVFIKGEVIRPGEYPLEEGMTVAALVRMAGGFTRSALTNTADVSSYVVEQGKKVRTEHVEIAIAKALAGDKSADIKLKPGDMVSIRQLAGWNDIGASITVGGEVRYPGAYSIEEGERLSSVIKRAGGFRDTAYAEGARLERVEVKQLAEKSRDELIQRIEAEGPSMKLVSGLSGQEQAAAVQVMAQQQQQALSVLRQQPVTGRLVIKISGDIREWENTPADIELRPGDELTIPKKPNFVLVNGQVYSPSAITYAPGKSVEWYLRQAGGPTDFANRHNIFVIRANGAVLAGADGRGFWKTSVLGATMKPGDTIVVPEKIVAGSMVWKNLLNTAQFTSSLALAARVVTSF